MSPEDRDDPDWEKIIEASRERERQRYEALERQRQTDLSASDWWWIVFWSCLTFVVACAALLP